MAAGTEQLWSLGEMERTGGEPDVIAQDLKTGKYIFCDCAAESPAGRRNLCYDREALEARYLSSWRSCIQTPSGQLSPLQAGAILKQDF